MKTLIISDLHGFFIQWLIQDAEKQGIDRIICLGDYDKPSILKNLRNAKLEKLILPGNHDYELCSGFEFNSEDFEDYEKLKKEWDSNPNEKKFILEAQKKFEETVNGRKICYLHGALCADSTMEDGMNEHLWGRIMDNRLNRADNFKKMRELDYWILFRGHDHYKSVFSAEDRDFAFQTNELEKGNKVHFQKNRRYIATIGKLEWGSYGVFDDKTLSLGMSTFS